jgi:hypothetical protein
MNGAPAFDNDIFISYAHIDNQPLIEGQKGWIDEFHHALETRLAQLLGEKSNIWRDKKLAGNDIFDETIVGKFPKTALLVSILSPRYVKSDWCLKELRTFCACAAQTRGELIGGKSRVFKVIKTHVPPEEHPPELQGLLGYRFYEIEDVTDRPREFVIDARDESYRKFRLKLDDLAYEILDLLKVIRHRIRDRAEVTPEPLKQAVYLAVTTSDLLEVRDQIQRELRQRGYVVLPDRPLTMNQEDNDHVVREQLKRSKMTIHLIGKAYGVIPEGGDRSIVHAQVELANECNREQAIPRVLWLPQGLKAVESRQDEFLTYLRTHVAGQNGVDLIEASIEELKTVIQDKLAVVPQKAQPSFSSNGKARIYLMCDKRDLVNNKDVRTVQQYLFQEGFEVILPVADGDGAQSLENHKENLVWCDAALIYYALGRDPWFWKNFRDLDKAFGYGRQKKWLAKAVYLAPPKTELKENLLSHEVMVIRSYESLRPEPLEPFVVHIKKSR